MSDDEFNTEIGRRQLIKLSAFAGAAVAGASLLGVNAAHAADEALSLKGKRIGISTAGTDHFFDLQAYNAQIAEVKRLGGEPLAVDAGRSDGKLVAQLQTLIAQKPDAIVQLLGTLTVIDPWLKRARDAGIPVLTIDVGSSHSLNNSTSDNWGIGKDLALQLVSDIGGEGNVVVFNGFYGVTPCAIRYDQLVNVIKYFPKVKIIQPELRDVIPNTVQDAFAQVTAILNKYPEKGSIKAIWSAWDIPQLGATQALAAAGRTEIKTYGVDGSPEVLQLVADPASPAAADVAQQPAELGRQAIQNVALLLSGKTLPRESYVPALLANKQTVNEVTRKLGIG
ncbi:MULTISPECIES: sugar ABC transporter substrate-binding protein [Rhizobium/Agrobacterium group]|uniref:sugar ABC transporter substrate-binding protein n=1 Tax=Rhizobium/Agrobacterium group TaxID=227290 RepID=UPI000B3FE911|nr:MULTISPECIES: sugar ABC transporter substrate-binding protein [Rhizobium/Agrobacterium group]MCF1480829.1 sugar ABC transporter substrate-binding protein [Allorhizobium ampelinum]MVA69690.1 substrate-binding domain-containing protein [Agrobacterium vitis]NSZ44680.1 sugar ABC transporter substrate-binding protein [Agrobacterium vitis]NTA28427.1 sugar ABC transporter substrate-binding protein [Allorhizobium ampelinum]OVE93053.1 sugar ABC transporter substrate-binding protein [Allorhizobium am